MMKKGNKVSMITEADVVRSGRPEAASGRRSAAQRNELKKRNAASAKHHYGL